MMTKQNAMVVSSFHVLALALCFLTYLSILQSNVLWEIKSLRGEFLSGNWD